MTEFSAGSMHRHIPMGQYGEATIIHDTPDSFTRLRASIKGMPLSCQTYTRLLIGGQLWMTDAEFEWRTNLEAVRRLSGDLLIAGLGVGFIIRPLLIRDDVKSITVIEESADVIALISPYFPTVNVIEADARTWEPPRRQFDSCYLDIWPNIPNGDDWPDIKALKAKYRRSVEVGGWVGAWCEDYARRRRGNG